MRLIHAICVFALFSTAASSQSDLTDEQKLDKIADFAERYCEDIVLDGGSLSAEVSGAARLDLNKILKALFDAGVEGAADFRLERFHNHTRENLLPAQTQVLNCRIKIFPTLAESFLVSSAPETYKCKIDGSLQGDANTRSNLFNNKGVEHSRNGEFSNAVECYEQALTARPDSYRVLQNLILIHMREEHFKPAVAHRYADRAISVMREELERRDVSGEVFADKLERTRRKLGTWPNLSPLDACLERDRITSEFKGIDAWLLKSDLLRKTGEYDRAVEVLSEVIETYPKKSCAHDRQVARAILAQANVYCLTARLDIAEIHYQRALELGGKYDLLGSETQEMLQRSGHYSGPVDDAFGPQSRSALIEWSRDGCPNLEDELAQN